jgi:hypothetical protein
MQDSEAESKLQSYQLATQKVWGINYLRVQFGVTCNFPIGILKTLSILTLKPKWLWGPELLQTSRSITATKKCRKAWSQLSLLGVKFVQWFESP